MGAVSKIAESLPEGFGYVIFTAVGSQFINMWMAMNVSKARNKYEVEVCRKAIPLCTYIFGQIGLGKQCSRP